MNKETPQTYPLPVPAGFTSMARYHKNQFGEVTVVGQVLAPSAFTDNQVIATLPEGFRPQSNFGSVPATLSGPFAPSCLSVNTSGEIAIRAAGNTSATYVYISFTFVAS